MSLKKICNPVLTCVCGNRFFAPLAKRQSSPKHVHTCLHDSMCRPHHNTVRTVVVLKEVITYVLHRSNFQIFIMSLVTCLYEYAIYHVICIFVI